MANLLSKPDGEVTYEPENLGENQNNSIITAYRKNLETKINYEKKFWPFASNVGEYD